MEFPKWHDRPNDSDKPVNKQKVLDGMARVQHFFQMDRRNGELEQTSKKVS